MPVLIDRTTSDPQTHILIIGVGGYPYLKGGLNFDAAAVKDKFGDLDQLAPATLSAVALYRTVMEIDSRNGWQLPLGSVEVLANGPGGNDVVIDGDVCDRPTKKQITGAFHDWWNRCVKNEKNCAIFYYCGHGLQKVDQYLLTEDFMVEREPDSYGAFNLNETYRAFHSRKTGNKLFLIDSCREISVELLTTNFAPAGLSQDDFVGYYGSDSFLQQSTSTSQAAFGKEDDATLYTKALISALNGQLATNPGNKGWVLESKQLGLQMDLLIARQYARGAPQQICEQRFVGSFTLVKFDGPPMVDVEITIDPEVRHSDTTLSFFHGKTRALVKYRDPHPDVWRFPIEAGAYRLEARSTSDPLRIEEDLISATPPLAQHQICFL
ncbi:caspase family protein [Chitinophaga sedimenti]|uniref:caspase family protein n=1 Tax=Chitinophaga sedimenti TaxID=2033606 RepID=UPI00200598C2|nr:caspase family protein [Chitinophaga sedimenti]MCK7559377.1 caspase family protein [Chitinophaga sedimenti]